MWLTLLLFVLGFPILIKGADLLVDGASSLAKKMGISSLIIGLTVVAFGTSAPELVVNLVSAVQGNTDLAIGNILGSNIANVLLILGVAAIISPVVVKKDLTWREIPFSLLAVLVLFLVANDSLLDGLSTSQLSRSDGLLMLCFFLLFMGYVFDKSRKNVVQELFTGDDVEIKTQPTWVSISFIGLGLIGLVLGGNWIVDGAIFVGERMGLSQAFLGLTVVAIGTSLPELATSVVAALKKESDIAIGNVVGSNIFNILFVLSITGTVTPLPFNDDLNTDIIMVVVSTFLLFLAVFRGKKDNDITRWQGVGFVLIYMGYLAYLVYRG